MRDPGGTTWTGRSATLTVVRAFRGSSTAEAPASTGAVPERVLPGGAW